MAGLAWFGVPRRVRRRGRWAALALALTSMSVPCAVAVRPQIAQAAPAHRASPSDRILTQRPYMGWSSWSLESTDYPGVNTSGSASWLTEQHVLAQADVMAAKLKPYGYEYVNIDAGWTNGFDSFGRPVANPARFPDGIAYVARYVHAKGLKLGIYLAVGLDPAAYNGGNTPIYGASGCYTRDIVYPDLRLTNGWDSAYQIDYASPCAQAYIDSIADLFASWGVDFLKLDGVGPGSFQGGASHDNTADVAAWSAALKQTGRPIQFTFTVTATGRGGSHSAASQALSLTTPAADGPAAYEAESPENTIGGGAAIASCSGCPGGEKVGYIGGGGYLIFNGVIAPAAGTYLMQISYLDGDSSRTGVVTVNGTSFELPLPGTNDNNWDTVQTATVPVQLQAGDNTVEFSNPAEYVYDVDKITL